MSEIVAQIGFEELRLSASELERLARQFPLRSNGDYDQAVTLVNWLVEQVMEDGDHPLRGAMGLVVEQVRQYDELHYRLPDPAPHELVEFLMEQRGIGFAEMTSIANAETLAAVIAGSLPIDAAMAQRLSELFFVSVELFVPPKPG